MSLLQIYSRKTPQNQSKRSNQQQQSRTTHQVEAEEDISVSSDCYQLFTLVYVTVYLSGQPCVGLMIVVAVADAIAVHTFLQFLE